MIKKSLLFFVLLMLGHSAFAMQPNSPQDLKRLEQSNARILGLLTYSEKAIAWRQLAVDAYFEMIDYASEHSGKFKADQLLKMHKGSTVYIRHIRRPIVEILREKEFFMDFKDAFIIQTEHPTTVTDKVKRVIDNNARRGFNHNRGNKWKTVRYKQYSVNPLDLKGQLYLRSLKLGLVSALTLLDNFSIAMQPYFDHPQLRHSILHDIPKAYKSTSKEMKKVWTDYIKKYSHSKKLYRAIDLFNQEAEILKNNKRPGESEFVRALDIAINTSFTFGEIKKDDRRPGFFDRFVEQVKLGHRKRRDFYKNVGNGAMNELSKGFGNSAGVFQSRHGKLYDMPKEELQNLIAEMKPLDVVMEKTPFRLTDKFIPGHYGHAAVWTGNENQLKELKVWKELPKLYKLAKKYYHYKGPSFQEAVRSGHMIIEALRPGVQINTMKHFLEIDDLAVLRVKDCAGDKGQSLKGQPTCYTSKQKRLYLIEAFKQIGKDYDFNFDVNTEKKIGCSELAYRTYVNTDFETDKTLGRHAISPDQVANKADEKHEPFYPVIIYFNGVRVEGDLDFQLEIMKDLLKTDYPSVELKTGICQSYKEEECLK